ncbi:MAG: diamine N-acetyltransferase [Planctomycetota bacterium]|jgi:diamine N-acetyltransferase
MTGTDEALPAGYPDQLPAVELRVLTRETYLPILRMKIDEVQAKMVASNAMSLAQASFHSEARPFGLFAGELPVGFVMFSVEEQEKGNLWVWRLLIAKEHQRKGFGKQAMQAIIQHARGQDGIRELKLSHVDSLPGSPGPFYRSFGFEYTGELDEEERIMRLEL